jgi:3-deoxy-7-phosphoheptulonate synthase
MVDCSHANSAKRHERQLEVAADLAALVAGGSRRVFGTMIESHLEAGAQPFVPGRDDPAALRRGQSITDACVGWDDTVAALARLARAVDARRAAG